MRRQGKGVETWRRLLDWQRDQTAAERLAAHILRHDGFSAIDPTHPLSGPDGLKDAMCTRSNLKWLAAAHFPRGNQKFGALKKKFKHDLVGVTTHSSDGFVFITNQELSEARRNELKALSPVSSVEIYHLERIASMLDSPRLYGVWLEYLDVEMTREEQLAFIADRDLLLETLVQRLDKLTDFLQALTTGNQKAMDELKSGIPIQALREFKDTLASITTLSSAASFGYGPHMGSLRVPLNELREFEKLLRDITSPLISTVIGGNIHSLRIPIQELREFKELLDAIVGGFITVGPIARLHVPLQELREYDATLDRILDKNLRLERRLAKR